MRIKQIAIMLFLACFTLTGVNGCYKMGKATGEAQEDVEEGGRDFKQGYEEGKS